MEADILEKGAIIQRDKQTFAVAPHIPNCGAGKEFFEKQA